MAGWGRGVSCPTGKVQYLERRVARLLRRRYKVSGLYFRGYRCQLCGFWHTGHTSGQRDRQS